MINSLNKKYKSIIFFGNPKDSINSIENPTIDKSIFFSISTLEKYFILFSINLLSTNSGKYLCAAPALINTSKNIQGESVLNAFESSPHNLSFDNSSISPESTICFITLYVDS